MPRSKEQLSKQGRSARTKGAAYERWVANTVSEWWGETFRRTPMSGGWAKSAIRGDIASIEKDTTFPFTVECKRQEIFDFYHFFNKPINCELRSWWWQADEDADYKKSGLIPMLLIRTNSRPTLAVVWRAVRISLEIQTPVCDFNCDDAKLSAVLFDSLLTIEKDQVLARLKILQTEAWSWYHDTFKEKPKCIEEV